MRQLVDAIGYLRRVFDDPLSYCIEPSLVEAWLAPGGELRMSRVQSATTRITELALGALRNLLHSQSTHALTDLRSPRRRGARRTHVAFLDAVQDVLPPGTELASFWSLQEPLKDWDTVWVLVRDQADLVWAPPPPYELVRNEASGLRKLSAIAPWARPASVSGWVCFPHASLWRFELPQPLLADAQGFIGWEPSPPEEDAPCMVRFRGDDVEVWTSWTLPTLLRGSAVWPGRYELKGRWDYTPALIEASLCLSTCGDYLEGRIVFHEDNGPSWGLWMVRLGRQDNDPVAWRLDALMERASVRQGLLDWRDLSTLAATGIGNAGP